MTPRCEHCVAGVAAFRRPGHERFVHYVNNVEVECTHLRVDPITIGPEALVPTPEQVPSLVEKPLHTPLLALQTSVGYNVEVYADPIRGRCVRSTERIIAKHSRIMADPCLRVPFGEAIFLEGTALATHQFAARDHDDIFLPCGLSALMAHSEKPSCAVEVIAGDNLLAVRALRDIFFGEDLTHDYNALYPGNPWFTGEDVQP